MTTNSNPEISGSDKQKPHNESDGRPILVFAVVVLLVAIAAVVWWKVHPVAKDELNVLNWDFYIGHDTLQRFEKEFGVKVNYEIYKDNEELFAKIRANPGKYDIAFPSDYMLERLRVSNYLDRLDHKRLPNFDNIDRRFRNNSFDPDDQFSAPYMFGSTGFAVNTAHVSDQKINWKMLAEPRFKGQIAIIDDMRFVLASALIELGHDPNSPSEKDMEAAVNLIRSVKPNVRAFTPDTPKSLIEQEDVWIAYAWSGDIMQVERKNKNITYVIPSGGSIRFQDGICIPRGSPHPELAHQFINFLLRPDVSADITNEIFYGNTNLRATQYIRKEILENPASFPTTGQFTTLRQMRDLPEDLQKLYARAWERVKN